MKIDNHNTDQAVLAELGRRLADYRLQRHMTQAQFAEAAGLSKRTVERLEAGESVQLVNLVRALRVLEKLDGLDRFLPDAPANPIDLLERHGKVRQRARPDARDEDEESQPWRWGDET
ncbi:MAG: transcriptional regulator with XRE-family HTH domain [Brevundimonas sp.]|jgi:transcriptional regulator with XRE-family HTH domain|uniref:helix-turn-helix transcriptional regulator n=1 Tax=Brevundimonas sp. TaxID=1871086 RepID=UPI0039E70609